MIALRFLLRMESDQRVGLAANQSTLSQVTPIKIAAASELFPCGGLITAPHRQAFCGSRALHDPLIDQLAGNDARRNNRRAWRSMWRLSAQARLLLAPHVIPGGCRI